MLQAVKVPEDLLSVSSGVLEEYVRQRFDQFLLGLTRRLSALAPGADTTLVRRAAGEALGALPPPDYRGVPVESLRLQLMFRHDCRASGCLDPRCTLCRHNTSRRCAANFRRKYLSDERLTADCGAGLRVELADLSTGDTFVEQLPGVRVEVVAMDGNAFEALAASSGAGTGSIDAAFDEISVLLNKRGGPLLTAAGTATNDELGRLVLVLTVSRGTALLTGLQVTDSCEAILDGRKPPIRLLARARHRDGRSLSMRAAVSESFVVVTQRQKCDLKADIPSVDDPVAVLVHMGAKTVKKLQDLRSAAHKASLPLPEGIINSVAKVGDFQVLARQTDHDPQLHAILLQVLKMSKDKWEQAREHALRAVVPDNMMRAWFADRRAMDVGLLFTCCLARVELRTPVALLLRRTGEGGRPVLEAVPAPQQTSDQRVLVQQLQQAAAAGWWSPGHPGWSVFRVNSNEFAEVSRE